MKANCNRCAQSCPYTYIDRDLNTGKRIKRHGMPKNEDIFCKLHKAPKSGFMLAEMALAYPDSLNEALSALPFKANLNFYLKQS